MLTSLSRCVLRWSGRDGVSSANDTSGDWRTAGVIATGVSMPSLDLWMGVWYGEVISRVIVGGVVGKSSTMISGISSGWDVISFRDHEKP